MKSMKKDKGCQKEVNKWHESVWERDKGDSSWGHKNEVNQNVKCRVNLKNGLKLY